MLREAVTKYGAVRGLPAADPRVTSFKGIPFAAPPVGENRWRAPQPLKAWDGVLHAYEYAPISVQDQPAVGTDIYCREWHVDKDIRMGEDCLYLNIWTPACSSDEKLPVFVWYFGGGLQWGYPAEMEFDGERLARRGIIVVSVNYRLNVFGFMAHREISSEAPDAPGNFGYLDQQAATRWVKENIASFGGDPDNITIGGQSAGGGSVMAQLVHLRNKGLFNRAIVMSGIIGSPYREYEFPKPMPLDKAEEWSDGFFELLGVKTLAEARKLDSAFLLQKYNEYVENHPRMFSVCDGVFLTDDPLKLALEGKILDVPVMAGNTEDEFLSVIKASDEEELTVMAQNLFGPEKAAFLAFEEAHERNGRGYGAISGIELSDKAYFEAMKKHGSGNDFYYYRFRPDIPGWDNPGTFHSVDLWFFFETLAKCWRPFKGYHYDLARQMANYWVNFISCGDPNGCDADGNPMQEWLPYTKEGRFEMEFTSAGPLGRRESHAPFKSFLRDCMVTNILTGTLKKQAFNPYLPSWEYVPDAEPYVFGDRIYVYGSHDKFGGDVFCMGDYVGWSAPVSNPGNWRYEGVIFDKLDDPNNTDGAGMLYAPDVAVGPDGRYYLYYVLSSVGNVSVAVCDTPAGRFRFYGHVHYQDGTLLGAAEWDEPHFDPGVLCEDGRVYLYTGFCGRGDKSRHGAMCTVLDKDMLTILEKPVVVVPGIEYSKGTGFEGHSYFEAASIRKLNDKYIFVYSSEVMHELCYALSDKPASGFKYGGVLISNCDLGIDSYKPADMASAHGANNHGSIIEIDGRWYVFYHRHTNGTWYSRQVCAEKLELTGEYSFKQAELTSCGLNAGPLKGKGYYPAYIVCNLFKLDDEENIRPDNSCMLPEMAAPKVTQSGTDGDECEAYISGVSDKVTAGFKYFDIHGITKIGAWLHGYGSGTLEVRTEWDGEPVGSARFHTDNIWKKIDVGVSIPDGVHALYFTYRGTGELLFKGFEL